METNAQQAINKLDKTISSFKSKIDVKVNEVSASASHIQATTDTIYAKIEEFKKEMSQGEESQIAHENILRIDQILKEQFGNHETIRRTVIGIVRDFDINLVRNSTIKELSEELWLTGTSYWLSYALIAITAWVNNYPTVAKNALAESGRKDAVKTTLFFCLMNLRFGRITAAKKWFYEYFNTLDPTMLSSETGVLIEAFLSGIFGRDRQLEGEITALIDSWISVIGETEETCCELVGSYEAYMNNMPPSEDFNYGSILRFCVNSLEIRRSFEDASKYDRILSFVQSLDVDAVAQSDSNYKGRVDAVLMNLISNCDAEELELRRQKDYFRFLIEQKGDAEKAEEQYREASAVGESENIGRRMINWALYDEGSDISVRKFAFQNTRKWFKAALNSYDAKLCDREPVEYRLKIDSWESVSSGDDLEEQICSLKNHFRNGKAGCVLFNIPNIAAMLFIAVSAALAFLSPLSLIITAAAAGFIGIRALVALRKYPKRMKNALCDLRFVMDEIAEFRRYFNAQREKKKEIQSTADFL